MTAPSLVEAAQRPTARGSGRVDIRCAGCGYGGVVSRLPGLCPMSGATAGGCGQVAANAHREHGRHPMLLRSCAREQRRETLAEREEPNRKGFVHYLDAERHPGGVLLWKVVGRVDAARDPTRAHQPIEAGMLSELVG